jgi:hypothetical protein
MCVTSFLVIQLIWQTLNLASCYRDMREWRLGSPPNWFGSGGKQKNTCPCQELNPNRIAQSQPLYRVILSQPSLLGPNILPITSIKNTLHLYYSLVERKSWR